jgi:hypothetical protein
MNCKTCQKSFEPVSSRHETCSRQCWQQIENLRRKERYKADPSYRTRVLGFRKQPQPAIKRSCVVCAATFTARCSDVTCGPACSHRRKLDMSNAYRLGLRQLARVTFTKPCAVCGLELITARRSQLAHAGECSRQHALNLCAKWKATDPRAVINFRLPATIVELVRADALRFGKSQDGVVLVALRGLFALKSAGRRRLYAQLPDKGRKA